MNNITLVGTVCRTPDVKELDSGSKVTSLNIASNTTKKGEKITTFYKVSVFGNFYDKMMLYIEKGTALVITGTLQEPRIYQSKDGENKVALEVLANSINFVPNSKSNNDSNEQKENTSFSNRSSYNADLPF